MSWITYDDFNPFILVGGRRSQLAGMAKFLTLQKELRVWNKEVFGCIETKKRQLLLKLDWIDSQRRFYDNAMLARDQMETWREYERVLYQEESSGFKTLGLNN